MQQPNSSLSLSSDVQQRESSDSESKRQSNSTTEGDGETTVASSSLPSSSYPPEYFQSSRRNRKHLPLAIVLCMLLIGSVTLLPTLFTPLNPALLRIPTHIVTTQSDTVGQLDFTSSGHLDPRSTTGLNDIISLHLSEVSQPPAGSSLYAWLLANASKDSILPILLGKLQPVNGTAQLSYQDPQHTDLLVNYSFVLVTQQESNFTPSSPPLDTKTMKYQGIYQGNIPSIPTPGDEMGYSLLSHLRHLLAQDPTLSDLGLAGGLNIWLYRNTGKIFEWSNSARDDWGGGTVDVLRREVDRVVQYMDGQVYAWRDLPPGTSWLVDPKAGRPGLIDVSTTPENPPSYLSHVRLHLNGMVNAPGHTAEQVTLANAINVALMQIEKVMRQVRTDALQLARMSDAQLQSQVALTLLDDMQVSASDAYIGQPNASPSIPGIVWVYDMLQQLGRIPITVSPAKQ